MSYPGLLSLIAQGWNSQLPSADPTLPPPPPDAGPDSATPQLFGQVPQGPGLPYGLIEPVQVPAGPPVGAGTMGAVGLDSAALAPAGNTPATVQPNLMPPNFSQSDLTAMTAPYQTMGGAADPRTVYSLTPGKVTTANWQNPNDHNAGLGWRVWVTDPNGNRMGYGHMDPSSTPPVGTAIQSGDTLGVYANPTNGYSTAPHVHVQEYDPSGNPMNPGTRSPLTNGTVTTKYWDKDRSHPTPHNGVDWVFRK